MIYGLRRMIYLLRKYDIISVPPYAKGVSSLKERYHIEDISPVPQGTDIIEKKSLLSTRQKTLFFVVEVRGALTLSLKTIYGYRS